MKALIYDLEIIKAIPSKKEPPIPDVEYCEGWHDHAGMGISVLGAYDCHTKSYHVFLEDNKTAFFELCKDRLLVTFNGLNFDNKVITACWGEFINILPNSSITPHYDILKELRAAHQGLPITPKSGSFSLDETSFQNGGSRKSGHGADAPIDWQRGKIGTVIDYCLHDVKMTKDLFLQIAKTGVLMSPKLPGTKVYPRKPEMPM